MADSKTRKNNAAPDPFDPKLLRLSDATKIGVKKAITVISCNKPNRQQFVRVHPDEEYQLQTALFTDEINREVYLVAPSMFDELAGDIQATFLFTAITKTTGNLFLWPVKVPDVDGRRNQWHHSALRAAELAMSKWVRVQASMADGKYDVFEASGSIPDPEWPDKSLRDILEIAFGDRRIDSMDHPVLQQLRGEI